MLIEVEDDGKGINEAELARADRYGVRGMRERVESLGGRIVFAKAKLGGLAVRVSLPLNAAVAV